MNIECPVRLVQRLRSRAREQRMAVVYLRVTLPRTNSGGVRVAAAAIIPFPLQYNWVSAAYEDPREPEQLELDLGEPEVWTPNNHVTLLVTENGAQLYASGFGVFLGKKQERLTVKHQGKIVGEVPFFKLQEVVIASRGISLSAELIETACERGIRLTFLSYSGRPFALLTSPMLTATVETRKAQFLSLGTPTGAEIARYMVAGKIRNQEKLLRYFGRTRDEEKRQSLERAARSLKALRTKALAVEGDNVDAVRPVLMGLEGVAGRMYWEQWVNLLPDDLAFEGRRHRGATDAVNASLNYGYGILTGHVWGAILNAGLEPFAGFLHVDRSGKPSLALDLMEEFRQPVVDRAVFAWVIKGGRPELDRQGMLTPVAREEVAQRVLARLNTKELHRGKEHQVRSVIQMQARMCASAVRELRQYRPFAFQW